MKRLVIDFSREKIRTALTDDERLIEIAIDDPASPQVIGNVYAGLVKRVLPNGFVFIDIGLNDSAFMDLNDKRECMPLKQGDRALVQVVKSGHGKKGCIVTGEICLSGKYAVVHSSETGVIGVSKKISDADERKRLKALAKELLPEGFGVIIRTGADGVQPEALASEICTLSNRLSRMLEFGRYVKAPSAIYKQSHLLHMTLQSLMDDSVAEVAINAPDELTALDEVLNELGYSGSLLRLKDTVDIFSEYYISDAFDKAFQKRVWLKSGGYIIIEQTEACVVIDVNTGKLTRKSSQLTTNCEAAVEIARQLRLRNLSGIIIVDFIGMSSADDKRALQAILECEVKKDRVQVDVIGMTELGLCN